MREVRIDKLTGDKAIYVSMRSKRPLDKIKEPDDESLNSDYSSWCPFCAGNEHMVEKETHRVQKDDKWTSRAVMNKFPAVNYESDDIFGRHEVIIETYRHNGNFFDMSEQEFRDMFSVYRNRYNELINEDGINYAVIYKNFQRASGASLNHPHSQIVSLNMVPPEVEKEVNLIIDYYEKNKRNLHQEIINQEIENKSRIIYDGDHFIAFIPDATRYNEELRIFAKYKILIDDFKGDILEELVFVFKNLFKRVYKKDGYLPFNITLHTPPKGMEEKFRLHFHIIPRRFNFGGFELSSNLFVCSSDPEQTVDKLRFNKNRKDD